MVGGVEVGGGRRRVQRAGLGWVVKGIKDDIRRPHAASVATPGIGGGSAPSPRWPRSADVPSQPLDPLNQGIPGSQPARPVYTHPPAPIYTPTDTRATPTRSAPCPLQFMIIGFGSLAASTPYLGLILLFIVGLWIFAARDLDWRFAELQSAPVRGFFFFFFLGGGGVRKVATWAAGLAEGWSQPCHAFASPHERWADRHASYLAVGLASHLPCAGVQAKEE